MTLELVISDLAGDGVPWDDAPAAYAARTTKVVLRRDPLTQEGTS